MGVSEVLAGPGVQEDKAGGLLHDQGHQLFDSDQAGWVFRTVVVVFCVTIRHRVVVLHGVQGGVHIDHPAGRLDCPGGRIVSSSSLS